MNKQEVFENFPQHLHAGVNALLEYIEGKVAPAPKAKSDSQVVTPEDTKKETKSSKKDL